MRTRIIKTVGVFFLLASANIFAADLSSHEQTCADLGFKKRTPAYGDCVLELDRRGRTQSNSQAAQEADRQRAEQQRQAQEQQRAAAARGDGSADHQTCAGFGFVAGTTPYSDCRMRLALAKREEDARQQNERLATERAERLAAEQRAEEIELRKRRALGEFWKGVGAALTPKPTINCTTTPSMGYGLPSHTRCQ